MENSWDPNRLEYLGVAAAEAEAVAIQINLALQAESPSQAWETLTKKVLRPNHPFELHAELYQTLVDRMDPGSPPLPVWWPDKDSLEKANATALQKSLDLKDFSELHQWSVNQRTVFWQKAIERLGIPLVQPPRLIADPASDPRQPRWLPGARLNIAESCFKNSPEDPAIRWRKRDGEPIETWTYGKLREVSGRVARGLKQVGFCPGDALAVDMVMNPESVAIYLGILRAGCAVISIADSFSAQEIGVRLRIGNAKGIFTMDVIHRGDKVLPMYEKVLAAGAPKAIVIPAGEALSVSLREGDLEWQTFLGGAGDFETVVCDVDDTVNILFSSGTTGDPKAIVWDHSTPLKAAMDGHFHHDIHPGDVVAWPTNLGWMMGPWLIFATLINRGTIALFGDSPTSRAFCTFVTDAKVSLLGVVPSLVKSWRQARAMEGLDWSALRAFSSTGECANAQDMHYLMAQAGYKPVIEYCGGTEIGGGYLCGSMVQPAVPAAFSTPCLGLDFEILDEEGHPANSGELFIIPPSIGLSAKLLNRDHHAIYYHDVPKLEDGRPLRRHGDQVHRLPGNYYRAEGRADDTMNLGGIKVGSAEIERVLNKVEGVLETAAIAIAPAGGGPGQLVIFAVLQAGTNQKTIEKDMQREIRNQLNPLFKIHQVRAVETLPRTASGKVMRRTLRSTFLGN